MTRQRHTTKRSAQHAAGNAIPRGDAAEHAIPGGYAARRARSAVTAGALTVALLGSASYAHAAGGDTGRAAPRPPAKGAASAAHQAAKDDATLRTLARFFARDGAMSARQAAPRVVGTAVPVYTLSAGFVAAGEDRAARTPVAELELYASEAVSSDGQHASVMAARTGGDWRVVNIATGDDETRYAAMGAKKAPGGTVFQEPQIDAWYVLTETRVLPLDPDARKAVGRDGTGLRAFHHRVHAAYADKLPGSAYDRKGLAGGFGPNGHGGAHGTNAHQDAHATGAGDADAAARTAAPRTAVAGERTQTGALGSVAATAGVGALVLGAAAGGAWLIRRRTGGARG